MHSRYSSPLSIEGYVYGDSLYLEALEQKAPMQIGRIQKYLKGSATIHMHFVIAFPIGLDFDNDRREIGRDGYGCLTADRIPPLSDDGR
jgi:hypothetical protein